MRARTLRAQLVALVLVLLTTVTLVVGLVTVLSMQRFLVDRLSDQATSAARRTQNNAPRLDGDGPTPPTGTGTGQGFGGRGPRFLDAPGNAEGTLGAIVVGGSVESAGVVGATGARQSMSTAAQAALTRLPVGSEPVQVTLPTLGDYLVLAQRGPNGATLVTGLPLGPVHDTVGHSRSSS
ncbi:hypothetical protein GCM10025868_21270 [Angustibacter aerolatus]|uniref:Two-component sensor histidine kinase n=1 Tax=Angustibacter aerolatus TaxID=1162965 RepID=A0ABQ6JF97_9ACTN|nr:hypothetical protein GCM10025868_21270 [Angustibacter aerolatus]